MQKDLSDEQNPVDAPWEDLVLSILSVNNYPLERTFALANALREQGLFEPHQIARLNLPELSIRLNSGGYVRGDYMTGLFAERLEALGEWIQQQGIEACTRVISSRNAADIEKLLLPIKGIGPKVLTTFFLLREITRG